MRLKVIEGGGWLGSVNGEATAAGWGCERRTPEALLGERIEGSEQEGFFAAIGWQAQTHSRGTLGTFDG